MRRSVAVVAFVAAVAGPMAAYATIQLAPIMGTWRANLHVMNATLSSTRPEETKQLRRAIQSYIDDATKRETSMLEILMRRQGIVVMREVLEQRLYSFDSQIGSNALEVLVHRLRRRLQEAGAPVVIHTVRGVGYLMAEHA